MDARNERSADALERLAERLAALPSEVEAFRDLAPVWRRDDPWQKMFEARSRYIGRYAFDGDVNGDPEEFLDGLRHALLEAVLPVSPPETARTLATPTGLVSESRGEHVGSGVVQVTPTIYAGDNANIVITVNTGSAEFALAMDKLNAVVDVLRGSNQIAPETKRELMGDIMAGTAAAKSGRANRTYLDLLLFRQLYWLAEKFAGSAISTAASEAVKALARALFE